MRGEVLYGVGKVVTGTEVASGRAVAGLPIGW
jgi:hypothetical protein